MPPTDAAADPLLNLKTIERLEVGPARIENRRLVAPYTVRQGHNTESFELIYRFEEDVFQPAEEDSRNLADLIAAQAALNYGLFCDEIAFQGSFDPLDRRLLEHMARLTAREIYVKKFLEPNAFLTESVRSLPVVRRDDYLQARIVFNGAAPRRQNEGSQPWGNDRRQVGVLSSGGKESLLSESLLRELGYETHPIFVNESGKHWFTALNAYRYFTANCPNTARVWTNCDRLFAWMLRRLGFIRNDFLALRSDEYPIRLWTVAVFLFGSLPLLRKRGLCRLVVGDEFDTTTRARRAGVPHYDGLYDQSRYFDQALTRYFHRKGWRVSQFSILRTLSELLIEKVLVERYPEIQRLQVSCHAAHITNGRAQPCGKCEKCARVVGMLKALGKDPGDCGYTEAQVEKSLAHLAARGASQEAGAVEHLAYLLAEKKLIRSPRLGRTRAKRRVEIMKLRFDANRSSLEDNPADMRAPLLRILLEHADGAVQRTGRIWTEFNPLAAPGISQPYPFETPGASPSLDADDAVSRRRYALGELTSPEARRRFQEVDVALLPVGAIEQHGPHLPLDTDAFDADYLCRAAAEQCGAPTPLVLPLIPYGVSYHHDDFAGTISISPQTLAQLAHEIGLAAARHGITKLVIVNGHGGNTPALQFAAQLINRDTHIFTCVESGETSDADVLSLVETANDVHAGEIETSTSLATRPALVRMQKAKKSVPEFSSRYLDFSSKHSVDWYARTAKISSTGVLGDPTRASEEKGKIIWDLMIKHLVGLIEDLKRLTLDEIHQRRML